MPPSRREPHPETRPDARSPSRAWVRRAKLLTGLPADRNVPRRYGVAGALTFAPSEVSRLSLYVQDLWGPDVEHTPVGFLQAEFSMGPHGAHPF